MYRGGESKYTRCIFYFTLLLGATGLMLHRYPTSPFRLHKLQCLDQHGSILRSCNIENHNMRISTSKVLHELYRYGRINRSAFPDSPINASVVFIFLQYNGHTCTDFLRDRPSAYSGLVQRRFLSMSFLFPPESIFPSFAILVQVDLPSLQSFLGL